MGGGSRHSRSTDQLPTKEVFFPCTLPLTGAVARVGAYAGPDIDGQGEGANIVMHIPHDFSKMRDLMLVVIPRLSLAAMTFSMDINYGDVGAVNNQNGQDDKGYTFLAALNILTEIDIRDALSVLPVNAGQYVGLQVERLAGQNTDMLVIGVRLRYYQSLTA